MLFLLLTIGPAFLFACGNILEKSGVSSVGKLTGGMSKPWDFFKGVVSNKFWWLGIGCSVLATAGYYVAMARYDLSQVPESGAYRPDGILHLEGGADEAHRGGYLLRGGGPPLFRGEPGRIYRHAECLPPVGFCGCAFFCGNPCAVSVQEPRNDGLAHYGRGVRPFCRVLQERDDGF